MPDSDYMDFEVKKSNIPNSGYGLFSKINITCGYYIGELRGSLIKTDDIENILDMDYSPKIMKYYKDYYIFGKSMVINV